MDKEKQTAPATFQNNLAVEPYLFCSPAGRVIYASGPLKNMVDEDLTGRNLNDFLEDALAARLISDGLEGRSRSFRCQIHGRRFSAEATPWEDAQGLQIVFFPLNPQPNNDRWTDPEQNLFVAREINMELAAMLPMADVLEEEAEPRQLDMLAVMRQRIFRLMRLSRNLQDSSMAELGELTPRYDQLELTAWCGELLDRLEPLCRQRKVTLRRALPEERLDCRLDPDLLRRMICHLVSNAVKAQPDGGSVDVTLKADGEDGVVITVIDHGCGTQGEIPACDFRRRSTEELFTTPGMGLGLPLTRAFAEIQGGRLLLMSSGGAGLVAKIFLPRNRQGKLDQLRGMATGYGVGIDPVLVEMSTVADQGFYKKG